MNTNTTDRIFFCKDNLEVMKGINSEYIDLIYLDPPFNKKKVFTALLGSSAEGASFKDIFREEDIKDEWIQTIKEKYYPLYVFLNGVKTFGGKYNYCYLVYMAIRLIECHRILKNTGSIYLHCDPTMSHYLKLLLDNIFDEKNFRNEIVWGYKWGGHNTKKDFAKKHDIIFRYVKSQKFVFNCNECLEFESKSGWKSKEKGRLLKSWWWDIPSINTQVKEKTGYPTQKPLALLHRIIKASSNKNDVILDPFCGCATTCIAAEQLNRQWIGIDVSVKAYKLVKKRLKKEANNPENLSDWDKNIEYTTKVPLRTDIDNEYL